MSSKRSPSADVLAVVFSGSKEPTRVAKTSFLDVFEGQSVSRRTALRLLAGAVLALLLLGKIHDRYLEK